jgi:hypothetical protein
MFIAGLDLPKDTKDPFHPLVTRLRESFLSLPKGLVWDQERSTNFNILLVDKVLGRKPVYSHLVLTTNIRTFASLRARLSAQSQALKAPRTRHYHL